MTDQLQHKNSAGGNEATLPAEFIAVCVLAFVAGVSATVYFCHSMCCEMEMPGGWTMSMMWMRMPGQTWSASATGFLLMWLGMMNPLVMIGVAVVIAAEKVLPWPEIVARVVGVAAIVLGFINFTEHFHAS